ncbi:MAG: phosphate propanoyltransferase [Firmicutes bacterium]|nr:phosphate propanoyltransferase [Bacillota bacterium]MBQ9708617.1 phosphate propanoyltransferase [Bacillota bacterium]
MAQEYEALLKQILEAAASYNNGGAAPTGCAPAQNQPCGLEPIPVGISNRHIHLSQADLDTLFGPGHELTRIKDLKQPGQFACKETLTVVGPKGAIEKIRVLGPVRKATQVELLLGDSFKVGVKPPIRMSGDLAGTPGVTLVGPKGTVVLSEGTMVAQRHIHMTAAEAAAYGVHDGQIVSIEFGGTRSGVLNNVAIRAGEGHALECHVDTEEANALAITSDTTFKLIK